MSRDSQRHLIVVRYSPGHIWYREWVNNRAEIDEAQVVWARELDNEANRKLLNYFKERRIWLLEADAEERILIPYSEPAT